MRLTEAQKKIAHRQRVEDRRRREEAREAKERGLREREQVLVSKLRAADAKAKAGSYSWEFAEVIKRAPRIAGYLTNQQYAVAVRLLLARQPYRPVREWVPQGKSATALFRSLANHYLARYPTPPFLWQAFFDVENRETLIPMVVHVAKGGSLFKYTGLRIPLTRKMCHEFMKSSSEMTVLQALRHAQVRALGGDHRLARALSGWRLGREIDSNTREEFWVTVIQWFAQQNMLDPAQIAPLCDYIHHRFMQDIKFSMKGRSALALIREKDVWHADLAQLRIANYRGKQVYDPSGFKPATYDFSREEDSYVEVWRIFEILTAKELHAEGKRQGHCVFSYARMIEEKQASIWCMTKEDNAGNWAMLTLEIRNATKAVVQARGRFNRRPTQTEMGILYRWCAENGLTTSGWL